MFLNIKVDKGMTKRGAMLLVLLYLGGEFGEMFTSNQIKECKTLGKWPKVQELKDLVEKQFKAMNLEAKAMQDFETCRQHGRLIWKFMQEFGLLMR